MAVDSQALAAYIGLDLEALESEDLMKAEFDKTYLKRDLAHTDKGVSAKVFGSVNGILRTKLKAFASDNGLEIDIDADPVGIIESLRASIKERVDGIAAELAQAKKGGKATPAEVEALQKELEAAKRDKEAFAANAKEWEGKFNDLDSTVKTKAAKEREDGEWSKALSAVQFRDDVNQLTRRGFESEVRGKYKLDFSEDGMVKVLGADGHLLMDRAKAQTYASLGELLKADATEAKLTGGAPQGGAPVRKTITTTAAGLGGQPANPAQRADTGRPQRQVAQRPERPMGLTK